MCVCACVQAPAKSRRKSHIPLELAFQTGMSLRSSAEQIRSLQPSNFSYPRAAQVLKQMLDRLCYGLHLTLSLTKNIWLLSSESEHN